MSEVVTARASSLRVAPLLGGGALLAIYVRIGALLGFQAGYGPPLPPLQATVTPFVYVTESEHRFWLAHLILAVPGALLIAWGLAPALVPRVRRWAARVDAASVRAWWLAALGLGVLLFAWSVIGRHVVMLDRPLTDDENAVTFGARMIAHGHLSIPAMQPAGAFTDLFLFQRDGRMSAMDFPGVLLFGALGVALGLGGLLYALACAVSGVAVAYAAGRWFGPRARVLAAVVWIASPMVSSLSLTNHGHIASRLFVALAIAFVARLDTPDASAESPRRDAILLGLFAGLGFLCRPFEVACLLAPIGGVVLWRALRRGGSRTTALWLVAGLVPGIAVFAWYNAQITGTWWLQARFAPGVIGGDASLAWGPWDRLGFNVGFNVLMLAVFFLGVPAIAAVLGGLDRKRPMMIALGAGVLAVFAVGLAHDNTGIHSVGPIHLSETVVPLTILATAGIMRGLAWLAAHRFARAPFGVLLAGYLAIACGAFAISNDASLATQARTQAIPDDTLAELGVHHAIVIAAPYIILLQVDHAFAPWGSWVLEYPHPDPFFRDDIIYAKSTASPAELHARFPDRTLYQMTYSREAPAIRVRELAPAP